MKKLNACFDRTYAEQQRAWPRRNTTFRADWPGKRPHGHASAEYLDQERRDDGKRDRTTCKHEWLGPVEHGGNHHDERQEAHRQWQLQHFPSMAGGRPTTPVPNHEHRELTTLRLTRD